MNRVCGSTSVRRRISVGLAAVAAFTWLGCDEDGGPRVPARLIVFPYFVILDEIGATEQFTAHVQDESGNLMPGVPVTWSSSNIAVASVDSATGLATAWGPGIATITAAAGSISGNARLEVHIYSGPGRAPVFAVDVSHWSGYLSEGQVACWWDLGVRHVVTGTQDPSITVQQLGMAVNGGMTVDAYVVLEWDGEIAQQVGAALSAVMPYPVQRLWLDAERPAGIWSADQLVGKIQEGVDACGAFPCGIYTRKAWWLESTDDSEAFAHLPLWYAYYNGQPNFDDWHHPLIWFEGPFGGWSYPTGKQYDSDQTAPDLCGVNVDYNIMYRADNPYGGRVAVAVQDGQRYHEDTARQAKAFAEDLR